MNWYKIPDERAAIWRAYMNKVPAVKAKFKFLFDDAGDKRIRSNDATGVMEEYLRIIENQDDLFAAAVEIIKEQCGQGGAAPEALIAAATTIDPRKTEMMAFIDDVESLINFSVDTLESDELGKTKLQYIRGDANETLTTLLLYPARLQNLFIQMLAQILVFLKQNPVQLDQAANPSILPIAVAQNQSDVYANAYVLTARPLRDGYYLNQGDINFTEESSIETFWKPLFKLLTENRTKTESELNIFANADITQKTWAEITADLFFAYKYNKIGNILTYFKTRRSGANSLPPDTQRRNKVLAQAAPQPPDGPDYQMYHPIPESAYDNTPVRETTLDILLSNMSDTTLQYILHLITAIKKADPSAEQASSQGSAAPAALIAPPRTDGSPSAPQGSV